MKYFNPSYWFKMWVLSVPLFNSKNEGIYAKSIDNQNIKDWASKNTTNISLIENQELTLSNNQTNLLNLPSWNTNLTTHNQHHKHRHQKRRNRIKKQVTPHPRPNREIEKLTEKLIIDKDNSDEYTNSFQRIRNFLIERNVFIPVFDSNDWYITNLYNDNFGYFRLPVAIRWQQDGQSIERNLELVFSADALYLQGFIITERDSHIGEISTYYYFNPRLGTSSGQYNPQLETIPNTNSIMLSHIGNSYRHLLPREDTNIYWVNIFNAFITLTNDINADRESSLGSLALSLGRVILITAEALRFRHWVNSINNELITNRSSFSIGLNNNNNIYQLLIRWSQTSQTTDTFILNRIYNEENNINEYESIYRELIQRINRIRDEDERNFQHDVVEELRHYSIDFLRTLLNRSGVSVPLLGTILSLQINNYNCNKQKREIKNTYWHEKFCDLKPSIDKIQGTIIAIKILKTSDIYVQTNNYNNYLISEGKVNKYFPEKTLHWREDKKIFELKNDWWNWEKKYWTKNFKMGWIDPKNYNRIEFLGDTSNSRISWGETAYYADKFNELEKADLSYYIKKNEGICDKNNYWNLKVWFKVQELKESWEGASIEGEQTFVFFSYKENDDYYLKIVIVQVATCHASSIGGALFLELGRGVRLYNNNDDESIRTKREIFNINNLEKKPDKRIISNELKNITKWTDDLLKDINHEQHLSIHNKTNFVKSNITSL